MSTLASAQAHGIDSRILSGDDIDLLGLFAIDYAHMNIQSESLNLSNHSDFPAVELAESTFCVFCSQICTCSV